jgi:hypothetical protein
VSDAAANLLDFLPSLGTGEVFAFGEGVALPTRVKLKQLPPHMLPKSDAVSGTSETAGINEEFIATVLKRWRWASSTHLPPPDDPSREGRPAEVRPLDTRSAPEPVGAPPLQPAAAAEPPRPTLLKRPLSDRLDISRAFQAPTAPRRLTET